MRIALLIFVLLFARIALAADGVMTLREVLDNTNRTGLVLLDQGYRGEFTKVLNEEPEEKRGVIEFTHAWFGRQDVGNTSAAAPAIAIGMSDNQNGQQAKSFGFWASYMKVIPDFEQLKQMRRIADFENLFGPFRGLTDRWGFVGEDHSSLYWVAFTTSSEGSLRVVSVSLTTINKGKGWEIENRNISEGVFRPTGQPPKMEIEKAKPAERGSVER